MKNLGGSQLEGCSECKETAFDSDGFPVLVYADSSGATHYICRECLLRILKERLEESLEF